MPTPAFRAAGAWVYTPNNVTNPSALGTITSPVSAINGDALLLICQSRSNTATVATPTGWNLLTGFPVRSGTALGGTIYVFARVHDGTGSDDPSVTWTGLTTGTTGDSSGAGIVAYSNARITLDATNATSDVSAATTTTTLTAVTTGHTNAMAIGIAIKLLESSGQTSTVSGFTERVDSSTTAGTGHVIEVSDKLVAAVGSSGTGTVTWSATTSARALTVTLALQVSPITAVVGTASETDASQEIPAPVGESLGMPFEVLAPVTPKTVTVDQSVETDGAQLVKSTLRRLVGGTSETEICSALSSVGPVGKSLSMPFTVASAPKLIAVATVFDTETSQVVKSVLRRLVSTITETDTPQAAYRRPLRRLAGTVAEANFSQITYRRPLRRLAVTTNEVDSGLIVTRRGTVGTVLETETVRAIGKAKTKLVGQVVETDISTLTKKSKSRGVGQSVETDTGRIVTPFRPRVVGTVTETDAVQVVSGGCEAGRSLYMPFSVASPPPRPVIQTAREVDISDTVTPYKRGVGTVHETEVAQGITGGCVAGRSLYMPFVVASPAGALTVHTASETDSSGIATPHKRGIGTAQETESAQAIFGRCDAGRSLYMPFTVQPGVGPHVIAVGTSSEIGAVQSATHLKTRAVVKVAEASVAQNAAPIKTRPSLGQSSELDTAQSVTYRKLRGVGQSPETDSAQTATRCKSKVLGTVTETDTVQPLSHKKIHAVGQAVESDRAQTIFGKGFVITVSTVTETTLARPLTRNKKRVVSMISPAQEQVWTVSEVDTCFGLTARRSRYFAVTQISEADEAQTIARGKGRVKTVSEFDIAQSITGSRRYLVGMAKEIESRNDPLINSGLEDEIVYEPFRPFMPEPMMMDVELVTTSTAPIRVAPREPLKVSRSGPIRSRLKEPVKSNGHS